MYDWNAFVQNRMDTEELKTEGLTQVVKQVTHQNCMYIITNVGIRSVLIIDTITLVKVENSLSQFAKNIKNTDFK